MANLQNGPVSVAIKAPTVMFNYKGGIFDLSDACPPSSSLVVNHAVVAVGYGSDNGVLFWKARGTT